ncbi:cobalt-precorrin-6A reductase [Streptomyces sp. AM 2-1-1]|uniref:cobalt-precorrin-6A reductase n=1 Tax=unclassified Streptomyces TaxID=2593676 RepID=UPI0023B8EE92|nr:cobalt-precorrin-6A reductase [Streptomyces sp. AM 2-1-1]WEH40956.1 cobalt-precorrin-6A reductase [Streptomyces sp. AM 2-1-1]
MVPMSPVNTPAHVLVLGGTTEARRLAEALAAEAPDGGRERLRVTSSLAGRVARPVLPPGEVRVGGFGGTEGLAAWLREHRVDALIDATHPFAGTISFHAARAAASVHVPLLALRRPGWVAGPGDDWHPAGSLAEAAALLPSLGERVFLTTGRMGLAAFAGLDAHWFLMRSVDAPEAPHPARGEVLLDRGPFTLAGERELIRRHRLEVLVTKDSGGAATAPKLAAAREAGIPVVVVTRPPVPEGVPVAGSPAEALAWLDTRLCRAPRHSSG